MVATRGAYLATLSGCRGAVGCMGESGHPRVLVHIVTFNSARWIKACLEALGASEFKGSLSIRITDNASADDTRAIVKKLLGNNISLYENEVNVGFSAAHNQGISYALNEGFDYVLVLNPDVAIGAEAIQHLVNSISEEPQCGMATPKLYRSDDALRIAGDTLDAAGMVLHPSLRHFDRGSNERDRFFTREEVFGGTGACLLLKRRCIEELLLIGPRRDADKNKVHPELRDGSDERAPLFDEAFFAYREDADLAWRAQLLGWRCVFEPNATGCHRRVVLPGNRSTLPRELNLFSVRNRFLLQLNNGLRGTLSLRAYMEGICVRNILVLCGVLFWERSSWRALRDVLLLVPRALERRRILASRVKKRRSIV